MAALLADGSGCADPPKGKRAGGAASATPSGHDRRPPASSRPTAPTPNDDRATVYDATLRVHWLADANLAANPSARRAIGGDWSEAGPHPIHANGTMSYATARAWVAAMNEARYLGHDDWQLPIMPKEDGGCLTVGPSGYGFGPGCVSSALGHLYGKTFGAKFPDSLLPVPSNTVGPFRHLLPGLYWAPAKGTARDGLNAHTYSFNTDRHGRNTTTSNYFHVLPVVKGDPAEKPVGGDVAPGAGVVPYVSGPLAGRAVYDTVTGYTWPADADLPLTERFGVSGEVTITFERTTRKSTSAPAIDPKSGTMLFRTANEWLAGMNRDPRFAVAKPWELPTHDDLSTLRAHLALSVDEWNQQLLNHGTHGEFRNLQSFFYWACPAGEAGACDEGNAPADHGGHPMACCFNFQSGFQGTAEADTKAFFVMVYHRDSAKRRPRRH